MLERRDSASMTSLALHCSGANGRQWAPYRQIAPELHLLTPDLIGYSDDGAHPEHLSLTDEVERLQWIIREIPGRLHLVGHSYGGAVALAIACRYPDLVHALTVYEPVLFHLLSQHQGTQWEWKEIFEVAERVQTLVKSGLSLDAAEHFATYWSGTAGWESMPPGRRIGLASRMAKVGAEFDALFQSKFDVVSLRPLSRRLRFVYGAESPQPTRTIMGILATKLPESTFIRLEGEGHMCPLSNPGKFARYLRDPLQDAPERRWSTG